ncbi:MAG: diguanylate cyclase [Lachnospiraceae bacterium]|nr:diguanylate cyclase [Lachnospiraceae bacterium]
MKTNSTILFVDDDNMNVKIGRTILSKHYQVDVAMSGHEALDYLRTHALPSLMLLDLHMPDMSGLDVLRKLKEDPIYDHLPVIILTADDDRSSEVEGFKLGVMDFITKPMVPDVLLERIHRTLALEKRQKELSTDSLTGLNIRTVGELEIEKAIAKTSGYLAFMDVDNLKRINDTIGHEAGDRVLKLIGDILLANASNALACRMGGDEFLLFFKGVSDAEISEIIESMIGTFLEKKERDPAIRAASISVGLVATTPETTYKEAYSKADKALYHVKQNGKDGYFFYRESNDEDEQKDEHNLARLTTALKNSGSYHGAMNVEFREFAKLYEYFINLKRRYNHEFHLVLLNVEEHPDIVFEEMENIMALLEREIRLTVRSVDVCTRYSSNQYLIILMDPGDIDQIRTIISRILKNFYTECKDSRVKITTSDAVME